MSKGRSDIAGDWLQATHDDVRGIALNLPRALLTEKAFPEDEAVLESAVARGPASVLHTLVYERRFGPTTQLEAAVPFGYRRSDLSGDGTQWSSGLGDLAIGLKQVLSHGLAHGHIEGFLTFGKLLPTDGFLQLQAGAERSTAEEAETELFGSLVAGRSIASGWGRIWSPMLELVARREGDEEAEWDVLPQLPVAASLETTTTSTRSPGSRITRLSSARIRCRSTNPL